MTPSVSRIAPIDIISSDTQTDHSRDQHGRHDQQRHPLLIGSGKLFNDESNPCDGRVERSRDTRSAARDIDGRANRNAQESVHPAHDGRRDLHGRPFASDRGADQQSTGGQEEFSNGRPRGNQRGKRSFRVLRRGHDLWDTRASGKRSKAVREPSYQCEADRGGNERRPAPDSEKRMESGICPICDIGEQQCDQAN